MKYQCIKTKSCNICGQKGTIQAFLNSDNQVKYARTRHYKQGRFSYCKLGNLGEVEEQLKSQMRHDHGQVGQVEIRSINLSNSSSNHRIVAGGEGFEPSTPNLGGWCSIRADRETTQHPSLRGDWNRNPINNPYWATRPYSFGDQILISDYRF